MSDTRIPLAAVIGAPVSQSKSPKVHAHWLRAHGLVGHYIPMDVASDDLEAVVRMLPRMGFAGVNITVPHKERVMQFSDVISDTARQIRAANTLTFQQDGQIHADNTDGYGFIQNLKQHAPHWDPAQGAAAILGAGGAARAVIVALIEAGVPRVLISNRTKARADTLKADLGDRIEVVDWIEAGNMLEEAALVVNTTSLGMLGQAPLRVPLDGLQKGAVVTDIVYAPLQTRLLCLAEEMGCHTVDGLGMLLHQAVPGFERWFGVRPEVDTATRAAALR